MRNFTKQFHIAIEAFHKEYGRYPGELKELDGHNEGKKVFFEGAEAAENKFGIAFAVDEDGDGFVETDAGKVKQSIAVWGHLDSKTMIKSWEE